MASPSTFSATTGTAPLPDIGVLSYNGVTWTALYTSRMSGVPVPDAANRTTKYVEWGLEVEGMVTLPDGASTTDAAWQTLRRQLSAPAGTLTYSGKGFGPFVINPPGGGLPRDVAWGPVPKVIDFKPMGASRSAMITWRVLTRIPEIAIASAMGGGFGAAAGLSPVLQFNEEIGIGYDEDAFTTLSIRGTLEIPLTRRSATDRTVTTTVDAFRRRFLDVQVDLTRFRVTKRRFDMSRDKRSYEWEFVAEQLPYMQLPYGCTTARGTYTVRPADKGFSLVRWICSLNVTYTVRPDFPRRVAWMNFVAMAKWRMEQAALAALPGDGLPSLPAAAPAPGAAASAMAFEDLTRKMATWGAVVLTASVAGGPLVLATVLPVLAATSRMMAAMDSVSATVEKKAWVNHLGVSEGVYLDSRTITCECSWLLLSSAASFLTASGVWTRLPSETRKDPTAGTLWASSMRDIMGWRGPLINLVDPADEVVVDFGGPAVPPIPKLPTG